MEKIPTHLKAENFEATLERWLLPEVGSSHVVGLEQKPSQTEESVQVVEEEIVAEKVTLSELEAIRESAYEEGFAQGKQDGYAFGLNEGQQKGFNEGVDKGQTEVRAQIERLVSVLDDLSSPLNQKHSELANWITELSLKVAETVLAQEVNTDRQLISQSLSEVVSQLPESASGIEIRLNPIDAEVASEWLLQSNLKDCQVVADESVTAGGCLVNSDNTRIDNSLEYRLEKVAEDLKSHLSAALNGIDSDESL